MTAAAWVFVLCVGTSWCHAPQATSGLTAAQCKAMLALVEMSRKHEPGAPAAGHATCIAPDGRAFSQTQQMAAVGP